MGAKTQAFNIFPTPNISHWSLPLNPRTTYSPKCANSFWVRPSRLTHLQYREAILYAGRMSWPTWDVEVVRNARALEVHPVYIAEHGLQEFYLRLNQLVELTVN